MQHSQKQVVIVTEIDGHESYRPGHQELIAGCMRGERNAQFEIYRRYQAAMYHTALRIVGDPDDAEDVMQEAFLKAFTRIRTYRGEVSFGAWLKKIVIHKALDFLRSKRDHTPLEEVGEMEDSSEEETGNGDIHLEVELIKRAVACLPEGYRVVLSLILFEGYDHEEVSEILNISNATSRTQYHRAKKKLLELLKKKDEHHG
ncbi:MAG TPA: RNA polymerase sigma factor [Bacteroides sp.]|nr:RNA polymerase sigma factor [Bacteroides sp.]